MAAADTMIAPATVARSRAVAPLRARIVIFSLALALKAAAGVLFFGSVDLVNSVTNSLALLGGEQVHLPYFPTINAFLWLGGVLAVAIRLPLPLGLKLVPIVFDSLLAVLIYDLVRREKPNVALRAGLLYALSPLGLLITSFHGQWDAIALFFLLLAFGILETGIDLPRREILFGAVFAISLLIKPIALLFLLLFPTRKRWRWLFDWPAMLGLAVVLGAGLAIFWSFGYSNAKTLFGMFVYSAKGVQTFGLPFAPLIERLSIQAFRIPLILPAIAIIGDLYHRQKLKALDAMLLFYLYCVATTGLSPQYLLWPLPLLIATLRLRLAAVYAAVTCAFLLFYYSNPLASFFPYENLGVFAPVRALGWLLPSEAFGARELLPLVHALGNVMVPLCAMGIGALVIRSVQVSARHKGECRDALGWTWYAVPPALVSLTIAIAWWTMRASEFRTNLTQVWNALPAQYGLGVQSLEPTVVLARDSAGSVLFNVLVLLGVATVVWCWFAASAPEPADD